MEDADCSNTTVRVAVRVRPFSEKEIREGGTECLEVSKDGTVILHADGSPPAPFAFDHVFGQDSTQVEVFDTLGMPLLDKAFEGYNATVFAYGQTGSGKTHTMMSDRKTDNRGLIPRISENLFERIAKLTSDARKFLVCCSFLEIYNEIVYDLLVPRGKNTPKTGLEIREGKGIGVYVKDLQEIVVDSSDKLQRLIDQGFEHRATAATQMNASSSRSHCLFIIKMHQKDDENSANNNFCKMNLVDLAGSERASRTGAQGDTLKEGANINKSLSALGNVINALSSMASGSKKVFIPYRNSKLTRVLQESLGGNALTTMMAALSPSKTNQEETLGTLNYAKRAKTIKVNATKNEEAEQIAKLQEEVEALRQKLTEQASGVADTSRYETQIQEMERFMKQTWEDKEQESKKHEEELKKLEAEAQKAAEKIHAERDRRLRLLEEKGDLELSVQELKSLDGPEAWAQTIASWPSQITRLLNLEQRVSAQSRAAALLKNAVEQDLEHWCERQKQVQEAGGKEEDGGAGLRMLLQQTERKVTTMLREFDSLTKQEQELKQEQALVLPQVRRAVCGIELARDEDKDEKKENEEGVKEDNEEVSEEYKAILKLVFRQLDARRAKAWGQIAEEHESLGSFVSRLQDLLQCCAGLGADIAELTQETELELAIGGSSGSRARPLPLHGAEAAAAWALPLGLASSEVPDASISSSSNSQAAGSVRLLGGLDKMTCAYGGWTPVKDDPAEFIQIDLGKPHSVCGVGLQGRRPCSGSWDLTRPLLAQLLDPADPLPPNRIFKRPPVRLIHDVVVAVHGRHGALSAGKPDFSAAHLDYKTLQNGDRQTKVDFFELLLAKTSHAIKGAGWNDKIKPLKLSSAEILGGKNTSESNRLLQILCYLGLRKKLGEEAAGGLLNVGDQWVTSFTLTWSNDCKTWTPLCTLGADASKPFIFEGAVDAEKMRYQAFGSAQPPGAIQHLRLHPQEWHGHAGMRLELYGWAEDAPQVKQPSSLTNPACRLDVVYSRGMLLQRCLSLASAAAAERWQERQKAEEAKNEQALQERTQVEQQLQDTKTQLEELKKTFALLQDQAAETEQKLMDAEADVLRLKVDCESYESQLRGLEEKVEGANQSTLDEKSRVRELEAELQQQKAAAEDLQQQIGVLTEERDVARSREEELFDTLTCKEEELMNTNDGYVYLTDQLNEVRDDYEDKLDQRDRLIETLNDRNKELMDEGLSLRQEIGEAKRKVAEAEKAVARAESGLPVNFKVASAATVDSTASEGYAGVEGTTGQKSKKGDGEYEEDFDDE
eukprot:TRINITY_DN3829_c0_g1_i1.p1 TRINITY_DN3829_c0_g1~~TRINITY_DN3829_c0_g1_i1.p1  ORF type:complete len:1300 (+),score=334.38 TRINITY_DN3829_c0_g1_i1:26-3901(+)